MRLSYSEIELLVIAMRAGDTSARCTLIESFVNLAFKVANKFKDDEAVGDALLHLVNAVDSFRDGTGDARALPAYVRVAINRKAFMHLRNSKDHQRHDAANDAAKLLHAKGKLREKDDPRFEEIDFWDSLVVICETAEEVEIVKLRAQGFQNPQIARLLGRSPTTILSTMTRIELRWNVQRRLDETTEVSKPYVDDQVGRRS